MDHWEKLTLQLQHKFDICDNRNSQIRIGSIKPNNLHTIADIVKAPQILCNIKNFEICEIQVNVENCKKDCVKYIE